MKDRIDAVVSIAAQHAAAVDSEAGFPAESFAALREQRLLGIMIPAELGGEGALISQVADVCYRLGRVCASTAMIYAMHQIMAACIVRHAGDNVTLREMLRRMAEDQLLVASSTTEGQGGGNIRSSEAPLQCQDGLVSLERNASVISYGAYADIILTTARRSGESHGSDQVLVAFWKSEYTLTRLSEWNSMGMRGTCSEGFILKAHGKVEQVIVEPYEIVHPRTMLPTAHVLWGGVWTGVATGAAARAGFYPQRGKKEWRADATGRRRYGPYAGSFAYLTGHSQQRHWRL